MAKKYHKNMISTMNGLLKDLRLKFPVDEFGKFRSLECMSFIKNKFYNEKPTLEIKTNSIYDMYNAAVFPYVEEYITEITVGSWLEEYQTKCNFKCEKIVKISNLNSQSSNYQDQEIK